jgi:hypothetical protein
MKTRGHSILALLLSGLAAAAAAAPVVIDASAPPLPSTQTIAMGAARRPDGALLTVNGTSLLRDGRPWLPVMGEFHYTRYPCSGWRDELLKMKAGGIEIVATYIFWIHHEEEEGVFDWSGQRDLRAFIQLCAELDLPIVLRIGPWCHGEVRHGGFPDWLLEKDYKLRSDDPPYLDQVRLFYRQIAEQAKGLLWKDGGPVIGIQLDNEYRGPAQHLLSLKQIAVDEGFDVPVYTRTGWPELRTPMPFGEILPLFGGYAEGFWDRELSPMPGKYWEEFIFQPVRTNVTVVNEQLGERTGNDEAGTQSYPYLTCELGPGMMPSYHRRILFNPLDAISMLLVKLGSGSNLPGYYMYHGGTNPDAKHGWLNERQSTSHTNWNDLPVRNYDFQTALGEFGQIRPQYHLLRRVHLFLADFGADLTALPPLLPADRPEVKSDRETIRWSVRSDGTRGYVFINNYQRGMPIPPKPDVQCTIKLAGGRSLTFPHQPVAIPADCALFWPFHLDLGGVDLVYATAQPICRIDNEETLLTFFAETPGIPAEFAIRADGIEVEAPGGEVEIDAGVIRVKTARAGTDAAILIAAADGRRHAIVVLDEKSSLSLYKGTVAGREYAFLSEAALMMDGGTLVLQSDDATKLSVATVPAPATVRDGQTIIAGVPDGVFRRYTLGQADPPPIELGIRQTKPAGPPRTIPTGSQGVAESPVDADFDAAAVWHIRPPADLDPKRDVLIRVHYVGDVARAECDGKLLTDNFYNGTAFDIGLDDRFPAAIFEKGIELKILPLQKDAPIMLDATVRPAFGADNIVVDLESVEAIERIERRLTLN